MKMKIPNTLFISAAYLTLAGTLALGAIPSARKSSSSSLYTPRASDPADDFLPTYSGPHAGDLDIARAQVTFTGTEFLFSATLQAAVGTTPEAFYVFGVDRGAGAATANFASIGFPNIVFDLVISVRPGGDSVVNDLVAGVRTTLPAGNVSVDGNTVLARVPLSMLESKGLKPEQYMWNLWPRWGGIPFGDAQISDFAPADRDAIVLSSERVNDAVDDFLPSYVGPHSGDLDVSGAQVTFTGTEFVFTATMQAPIGTTPQAFYVFGVDRGAGAATANFASLGFPDITFDLVVSVRPGGSSVVNDLNAGVRTTLPSENVTVDGNNLLVRVPVSMLESKGLTPQQYLWNLWPRWDGVPFGDPQISDFSPANRTAIVNSAR